MAGLLQFDPNDPANALLAGPASAGVQTLTPQQAPVMTPDQIASVRMAPTGVGGLLSGLKDATYTPDGNGMTFWDKLGAFGQTLSHAQAGLDGTLGGAAGGGDPGLATLQAYKDKAAQQAQRQKLMSVADQLNLSPREKLVFLANPEEWSKQNATRYGFHDIAAGNTGAYGDPTDGGKTYMANQFFRNDNVTGMQTANGTQNVQSGPLSADDIAKRQTALNGAMEAAKPMSVPEGGTVFQPAVNPALVAGMGGAGAAPTQGGGVLYHAPKTYAPTDGGGGGVLASLLTPDSIQTAAEQYAVTGIMPSLGVGKTAVPLKTAIMNRAAEIQKAGGIDGYNALYGRADNKAQTAALAQAMKTRQAMETAEGLMNSNLDAALGAARKGGVPSNALYNRIPYVSDMIQGSKIKSNDPLAVSTHGLVSTSAEELAKLTGGANNAAATDSSRAQAHGRLNDGMSLAAFEAAANAAKLEARNRIIAQKRTEDDLRKRIIEGSYGQNAAMKAGVSPAGQALIDRSAATRSANDPLGIR